MFCISVLIGMAVSLCNIVINIINMNGFREVAARTGLSDPSGFSLFVLWLPMGSFGIAADLYRLAFPIIAALPFGGAYWKEMKNGYSGQVIVRMGIGNYYIAKYLAVFIGGGTAVSIILFANLLINALVCPAICPSPESMYMTDWNFLVGLYVTHPWIHAFVWIFISFITAGAAATVVFVAGSRVRHQAVVLLSPFVLTYALSLAGNIAENYVSFPASADLLTLFSNLTYGRNPLWWYLFVTAVLALTGAAGLLTDRKRHEFL